MPVMARPYKGMDLPMGGRAGHGSHTFVRRSSEVKEGARKEKKFQGKGESGRTR